MHSPAPSGKHLFHGCPCRCGTGTLVCHVANTLLLFRTIQMYLLIYYTATAEFSGSVLALQCMCSVDRFSHYTVVTLCGLKTRDYGPRACSISSAVLLWMSCRHRLIIRKIMGANNIHERTSELFMSVILNLSISDKNVALYDHDRLQSSFPVEPKVLED